VTLRAALGFHVGIKASGTLDSSDLSPAWLIDKKISKRSNISFRISISCLELLSGRGGMLMFLLDAALGKTSDVIAG